mgnify:FL=1
MPSNRVRDNAGRASRILWKGSCFAAATSPRSASPHTPHRAIVASVPLSPTTTHTRAPLACRVQVFNGEALHPVDMVDVAGTLASGNCVIGQLVDPLLTTICPVTAVHPSQHLVASGTSKCVWGTKVLCCLDVTACDLGRLLGRSPFGVVVRTDGVDT